jgi:predicted RNA-binding Zn-ribbon protein involved in translation (DUF1610 family)
VNGEERTNDSASPSAIFADDRVDRNVKALPCPFCGSERIGCHAKKSGRKSGYQCRCLLCGIAQTGRFYDNPDAAKAVWNTRDKGN